MAFAPEKTKFIFYSFIISVIAAFSAIYLQWPAFFDPRIMNNDVKHSLYWFHQEPGLFQDDILTRYATMIQPIGFVWVYKILSLILDPVLASKFLPVVLFAFFAFFTYRLIHLILMDVDVSFFFIIFFIAAPIFWGAMVGGSARAFAWVFLVAFLYYVIGNKYLKSSVVLLLQSIFYPPVFLLSATTVLLRLAFDFFQPNKPLEKKPGKYFSIIAVVLGVIILSSQYFLHADPQIGQPVSKQAAISNPAFYTGGRVPVFPEPGFLLAVSRSGLPGNGWLSGLKWTYGWNEKLAGMFLVLLLIILYVRRNKKVCLPREFFFLFASSVVLYKSAYIFFPKLYMPARYLSFSIPLICFIAYTVFISPVFLRFRQTQVQKILNFSVLLVLFIFLKANQGIGLERLDLSQALIDYIKNVPSNALIAAHPQLADGIPVLAQRKVLINQELSIPLLDPYWNEVTSRTEDFFDAYYADSWAQLKHFFSKYKIDYLIVDTRHFEQEYLDRGWFHIEPFNSQIKKKIERQTFFILTSPKETFQRLERGRFFIIRKEDI